MNRLRLILQLLAIGARQGFGSDQVAGYLDLVTEITLGAANVEAALIELHDEIRDLVAAGKPPTPEAVEASKNRILANHGILQGPMPT